jgi:hypothetical protein
MIKKANVRVEANDKEFPVSSVSINTAFDGFSHIFKITSPYRLTPFVKTRIKIFINETPLLTGVVLETSTNDAEVYTYSGKTNGWFLEKNVYSPNGVAHTLKNVSLLDIANFRAAKFDLKFETDASANAAVNSLVGDFTTGDSDSVADVIVKCGHEKGVYCRSELGGYNGDNGEIITFYSVNSLGTDIFTLDGEKKEIPFEISQITYNNDALFSTYYGIFTGKEASFSKDIKREYANAPYISEKIVKAPQDADVETAIDAEVRKDYISALSVSVNFPFVLYDDFPITAGNCFTMSDKKFRIDKRNFFITEANYNFTPDGEKTSVSACLSSSRFGLLDE